MNSLSNLPPGVTNYDIEEAAGAFDEEVNGSTCADCYEIGVIRNSESPRLVNLCAVHSVPAVTVESLQEEEERVEAINGTATGVILMREQEAQQRNERDGLINDLNEARREAFNRGQGVKKYRKARKCAFSFVCALL